MEIRGRVSTKYRVWPTETLFIFSSESRISHFRTVNRYISHKNKQKERIINLWDPKIKRRFASLSLQMLLGCCECWMFPHLSCVQWQLVTPGPCATSLHIHQLYTQHFLLQIPRNQTGRPTLSLISTEGDIKFPVV